MGQKFLDKGQILKVIETIKESGLLLLDRYRSRSIKHLTGIDSGYVKEKSEKELVIREDLISQDIIIKTLENIAPGVKVFSEELNNIGELENDQSEFKFILDPLDGTHNFYYGLDYWGIGLAILNKFNQSIMGFIYLPAVNLLLKNLGEDTMNFIERDQSWIKSRTTSRELSKSILCYDNQFYKLGRKAIKIYELFANKVFTSRITGSALSDAALIATGCINGRIWNRTQPYDIAPGIPIVTGAKGVATNFDGNNSSVMNESFIMSSNIEIHNILLKEIKNID